MLLVRYFTQPSLFRTPLIVLIGYIVIASARNIGAVAGGIVIYAV